MVAVFEAELTHFPDAVALAVITSPVANVRPEIVQAFEVTVTVPREVDPALNTSILVPSASVLVPTTVEVVDPTPPLVMVVITGAADIDFTVTVVSAPSASVHPEQVGLYFAR